MKYSKRLTFLIASTLYIGSAFTQRIAMYDIIGTTEEVIVPFKENLGFKLIKTDGNLTVLVGKLNNEPVTMNFYQTPMSHLVHKVVVESNQWNKQKISKNDWDSSKRAFNNKFTQLENRYGKAEKIDETRGEVFERKKCKKPFSYKASWINMPYFQNLSLYCELQKNGNVQVTYIVKNNALKNEQELKLVPAGSF